MNLRRLVRVLALFLVPASATAAPDADASAQEVDAFAGEWHGFIEVPGAPLEVRVFLERDEGQWIGSIDIPARGAVGLPLGEIAAEGTGIRFAIADVAGDPVFDGSLIDGTIEGCFFQSGKAFPFGLTRVDAARQPAPRGLFNPGVADPGPTTVPPQAGKHALLTPLAPAITPPAARRAGGSSGVRTARRHGV